MPFAAALSLADLKYELRSSLVEARDKAQLLLTIGDEETSRIFQLAIRHLTYLISQCDNLDNLLCGAYTHPNRYDANSLNERACDLTTTSDDSIQQPMWQTIEGYMNYDGINHLSEADINYHLHSNSPINIQQTADTSTTSGYHFHYLPKTSDCNDFMITTPAVYSRNKTQSTSIRPTTRSDNDLNPRKRKRTSQ